VGVLEGDVVGRWIPRARAASTGSNVKKWMDSLVSIGGNSGARVWVATAYCAGSRRSCPKRQLPHSSHGGGLLPHSVCPSGAVVSSARCAAISAQGSRARYHLGCGPQPPPTLLSHLTHRSLKFLILASSGIPGLGLHVPSHWRVWKLPRGEDCRVFHCSLSHCPARSWAAEFLPQFWPLLRAHCKRLGVITGNSVGLCVIKTPVEEWMSGVAFVSKHHPHGWRI
jgi:hypothetical protein